MRHCCIDYDWFAGDEEIDEENMAEKRRRKKNAQKKTTKNSEKTHRWVLYLPQNTFERLAYEP